VKTAIEMTQIVSGGSFKLYPNSNSSTSVNRRTSRAKKFESFPNNFALSEYQSPVRFVLVTLHFLPSTGQTVRAYS